MTQSRYILHTGLDHCYNDRGEIILCKNSGQDAEYNMGLMANGSRFKIRDEAIHDELTGLIWPQHADVFTYPLDWEETLNAVEELNIREFLGYSDWRLPNRRELRSLISHGAKNPALPEGSPFLKVFLGWYWTSTTSAMAPAYAWRLHFGGGRMFYGNKKDPGMGWPVRGNSSVLACTGQYRCYDTKGCEISCDNTCQDGTISAGTAWPSPRFESVENGILDRLTMLVWAREANLGGLTDWQSALDRINKLNSTSPIEWRLPNINELESLVDASKASPALSDGHPFVDVQEAYWSSTTSFYETDWSYALYLHKGAVGVGYRIKKDFYCWPVSGPF